MKIAIDCRYLGMSGIGRYLEGVLENLDFFANEYYLIGKKDALDKLPYKFNTIECDERPFSARGLFSFPTKKVNKCDVFFSPNFIIPYGIKIRVFSTIHDVLFLDFADSNNNRLDYFTKKFFLNRAIRKSERVFTVSNFSKNRIVSHFKNSGKKIVITGNAVTKKLQYSFGDKAKIPNSLIYVGNIKKHKGLSVLYKALEILNETENKYTLTVVGTKENFRTSDEAAFNYNSSFVKFTGYLDEKELVEKISSSEFLVQPSFYEGFGITPLEALYFGTKPIISDIDVFKEVYGDISQVAFFKCGDAQALAETILNTSPTISDIRDELDSKYNYRDIASKILLELENGKHCRM